MENQINEEAIRKIVNDSPNKKCQCGCEYFDRATIQKEISALVSSTGKNEILLIEVLLCRKCDTLYEPSKIVT